MLRTEEEKEWGDQREEERKQREGWEGIAFTLSQYPVGPLLLGHLGLIGICPKINFVVCKMYSTVADGLDLLK